MADRLSCYPFNACMHACARRARRSCVRARARLTDFRFLLNFPARARRAPVGREIDYTALMCIMNAEARSLCPHNYLYPCIHFPRPFRQTRRAPIYSVCHYWRFELLDRLLSSSSSGRFSISPKMPEDKCFFDRIQCYTVG